MHCYHLLALAYAKNWRADEQRAEKNPAVLAGTAGYLCIDSTTKGECQHALVVLTVSGQKDHP
jgi:hypothetical protein